MNSQQRSLNPASPCISVCTLDDDDRCLGCGRSLEQITRWTLMSREEQWAVDTFGLVLSLVVLEASCRAVVG